MAATSQKKPEHDAGNRQQYGTLYGIGVGPGAPDLLTVRAVRVLQSVDVVLAAASPKNEGSNALSIARPHLPENCEVLRLDFPMTRDKQALAQAWRTNAEITAAILRSGKSAAFLTLGDPLIYSTFGYLMRTLKALDPLAPIEVIPGITSYQEAAARTATILCEGEESLLLISGINRIERLDRLLEEGDSAVMLKTYRNADEIRAAVSKAGRDATCIFASRLGLEGEISGRGLKTMPEKPHYLSLLLLPADRDE